MNQKKTAKNIKNKIVSTRSLVGEILLFSCCKLIAIDCSDGASCYQQLF